MILIGFWFFGDRLRDGRPIPPDGEWLEHEGELVPCKSGLHASACPFDALRHAPGAWLALVECDGQIVEHGAPPDKFCARRRRILRRIDATAMLRQFARECALSVLHLWDAPAVVKEYLQTGDEKLRAAAWDAAWDAAGDAARAAAWDAARAAADTARAAADTARAAADTARAAAWDAARDAAWTNQRKRFRELVHEKFPEWEGEK